MYQPNRRVEIIDMYYDKRTLRWIAKETVWI